MGEFLVFLLLLLGGGGRVCLRGITAKRRKRARLGPVLD
jgi:hypothetical protein